MKWCRIIGWVRYQLKMHTPSPTLHRVELKFNLQAVLEFVFYLSSLKL